MLKLIKFSDICSGPSNLPPAGYYYTTGSKQDAKLLRLTLIGCGEPEDNPQDMKDTYKYWKDSYFLCLNDKLVNVEDIKV